MASGFRRPGFRVLFFLGGPVGCQEGFGVSHGVR